MSIMFFADIQAMEDHMAWATEAMADTEDTVDMAEEEWEVWVWVCHSDSV